MRFLLVLFLLVFCTSCSKKPPEQQRQSLNVNFAFEPLTLDPRKGGDYISSSMHFMLFQGLTRYTPQSSTALALADQVEISNNRLTYTFHLREAYWSNGDPIVAADFEHSWKSMLDPSFPAPNAYLLYPIKNAKRAKNGEISTNEVGVRAINDKTLVVELRKPTPYFLELTSFCALFPINHKVELNNPNWHEVHNEDFVCSGPFSLKEWRTKDLITIHKNPKYWNHCEISLEEINISLIESSMTAYQMYENGDIDLMGTCFSEIPIDSIPHLVANQLIHSNPIGATSFITFNTTRFPLSHPKLRRALAYAIDRKSIVDDIKQLGETIATGPVAPILKGGKTTEFYEDANLPLARKLFQEAIEELGILKPDLKFQFAFMTYNFNERVAQEIQQQWKKAFDIDIPLIGVEIKTFLDTLNRRDYDLALFSWSAQYRDPMNVLDRFKYKNTPKNYADWENLRYAKILNQSEKIPDAQKRYEFLEKAERIFTSEMPVTCLYHWNMSYLKKDYVDGFYISPIGSVHLDNVKIKK
ncbi:MAG: peptide ABC transporter substrate-binding protein [Simkaniaceae bacterium]|nr:peptide ABC transporter substrate-binding protein [Simkaniaceae bacterium]